MLSAPFLSNKFATWPHTLMQPGSELLTGVSPATKPAPAHPINRIARYLGPALYDGKPKPSDED